MDDASHDVMRQFQQLMSQFLQTQALVMTTYLQGAPAAGLPTRPAIPAPRAFAPRPEPPIEDAAAPSIRPATEPAGPAPAPPPPVAAAPPAPPPAAVSAPADVAATAVRPPAETSPADVLAQLLGIVSDRTGYPQEMLDPDANIEADLGIDSIKRIEILTAFQQAHAGGQRGSFQSAMEKLTAIKTLRDTAAILADLLAGQAEAAIA